MATPAIEGPVTGGRGMPFLNSSTFDLATVGYEQAEFFLSGTATAFTSATPLTSDGNWTVAPGATAPYTTRIVVYRPSNPKKFNGTVVVEWLNVSGGLDAAPDWTGAHTELIRDGFAWIGVSAQYVGVEGGPGLVSIISLPLKTSDPVRYASLKHPGDSFSYDMFSQVGQAVRAASETLLGPLKVKRVIAAGESQSAFRMVTYVDAIHPVAGVYDGFMIHSRGNGGIVGAALSESPQPNIPVPVPTLIRTDLREPVLMFQTETDLTFLDSFSARQPDTDRIRLWEVAGTAHADAYLLVFGGTDAGKSPEAANIIVLYEPLPGLISCNQPVNSGPQHWVLNAAFAALDKWVRTGKPPKPAPRLEVAAGPPRLIMRDAHGNALGGIRTPPVDVPLATYTGEQDGSIICRLLGTTTLLDPATVASLYPTHKAWMSAFAKSTRKAVKAGHLLKPDAKLLQQWAATADVGG